MRNGRYGIVLIGWVTFASVAGATAERHILLDDCVVSGCANGTCSNTPDEAATSACAVKPEHVCYAALGECKRQPGGQCGWTPSLALTACLAHPPKAPGTVAPKNASPASSPVQGQRQ